MHALVHAAVAVGLFKGGEACTYKRRAGWLALAAVGGVLAHHHHHRR
jgi:hypothetical protein